MIRTTVVTLSALLFGAALLFIGHGLQATLVPLLADQAGYGRFSIGLLWSGYAAGLMTGAIFCGRIIVTVGHIRTFSALASGVAVMVLLYAFAPTPTLWFLLRFCHGFLIAGVFMVIESWLNDKASNELRGLVLSIYSALSLLMISVGQLGINLLPAGDGRLFSLAGLAFVAAVIPVALTRSTAPGPVVEVSVKLKRLWDSSRAAVIGALCAGLTTSAFWGLGPVFALGAGLGPGAISLYLSLTVLGGASCQWILGRASDFTDRRRVVAMASFGAALTGLAVAYAAGRSLPLLLAASFFFGAFAFSISSLCIAMANDRGKPGEFVEISGGLLFIFSAGSVMGSLIGSAFMEFFGNWGLYLFTAIVHGALAVIALFFALSRAPVPATAKRGFRQVPVTSPEAYVIDPRAGGGERPPSDPRSAPVEE